MSKIDPNPGQGGGGEPAAPNSDPNAAPNADPNNDPNNDPNSDPNAEPNSDPNSDPLDAIEDPVAREEAKKHRAIARRVEKNGGGGNEDDPSEPAPAADPAPAAPASGEAATKDDLKTLVLADAKKMVAPEVAEVWDELKAVPLGGFDSMDAESVASNMIKRYNLYRMDNPADPDNPAAPLSTTPNIPSGGGQRPESNNDDDGELPNYHEPVEPDEWYGKDPNKED